MCSSPWASRLCLPFQRAIEGRRPAGRPVAHMTDGGTEALPPARVPSRSVKTHFLQGESPYSLLVSIRHCSSANSPRPPATNTNKVLTINPTSRLTKTIERATQCPSDRTERWGWRRAKCGIESTGAGSFEDAAGAGRWECNSCKRSGGGSMEVDGGFAHGRRSRGAVRR